MIRGVVALLLLALEPVNGWNSEGHRIVARIASGFMARKTSRYLREHLLPGSQASHHKVSRELAQASVWADTVVDDLPWSSDFHFVNTPFRECLPFNLDRDCGTSGSKRCLVTAIANYTMRASDISLSIDERVQAIKFLSHFVADAHQPLHGGFVEDLGATRLILSSPEDSLHEVWDSCLIANLKQSMAVDGDDSWYNTANALVSVLKADDPLSLSIRIPSFGSYPSESEFLSAASWMISETVTQLTCSSAYRNEIPDWIKGGESLTDAYMHSRTDVVKTQLMKAGIRLAQILDAVASNYYLQEHRLASQAIPMEVSSGTPNKFDVLAIDFSLDIEEAVYELPTLSDDEEAAPMALPETAGSTEPDIPIKSDPEDVDESMTAEEKKREQNRKKRLRQKVNKRKQFGVDIESLVLIKRDRKFYITYKHLVDSDSFEPRRFMIVMARFAGMSPDEPSIPFLFDFAVFGFEDRPPDELFHAVFRKIAGQDSEETELSTPVSEFAVQGKSYSEFKQTWDKNGLLNQLLAQAGLPGTDYSPTSLSAMASSIRKRPSAATLRAQYRGKLPEDSVRIYDTFISQAHDIVSLRFGSILLVSTATYLLDNSNNRWIFIRRSMVDSSKSLSDTYWLYFDARVLNDDITVEVLRQNDRLASTAPARRRVREVLKKGSRILDRLSAIFEPGEVSREHGMHVLTCFCAIRIASDSPSDRQYIEYVMRPPEEEKKMIQRLRMPPVKRLTLDDFYYFK